MIEALVLDATPLITHGYQHYASYAQKFYTTPTVFQEIKDINARKNLEIWEDLGVLIKRHPSAASIEVIKNFSVLTGDFQVLSANDIHILALTYEVHKEINGGDDNVRKIPGQVLELEEVEAKEEVVEVKEEKEEESIATVSNETTEKPKKKRRRGGKKQKAKMEARALEQQEQEGEAIPVEEESITGEESTEMSKDEDDDGDWITPDNLATQMMRDQGEDVDGEKVLETSQNNESGEILKRVALATGDFAVQNVALQMNLKLMNFMNGLRITKLRNYMLRCHGCFKMLPLSKNTKTQNVDFCPNCGGFKTLMRCAISIDSTTGAVIPHLKKDFHYINRGNKYSVPSPLSKRTNKKQGNRGFVHTNNKTLESVPILREDQKEYEKHVKQQKYVENYNEKLLNSWYGNENGTGSADNVISPFGLDGLKHHSNKIGHGRHVNSNSKRRG